MIDYYEKYSDKVKGFLAQGSEDGFGKKYARGINDHVINSEDQFLQVVSCNTHNIACLVNTIALSISPDKKQILIMERSTLTSIEELSQPELRLAGLRMNPATNGRSRSSYYTGLVIQNIQRVILNEPINWLFFFLVLLLSIFLFIVSIIISYKVFRKV